jgi:hypothetical protein
MGTASLWLDDARLSAFREDGYLVAERLFDAEEIDLLGTIARADRSLRSGAAQRRDGAGGVITLAVQNQVGDDIYAAFVRCRRIVEAMERLLGDEVYHYHHKMILKEPQTGGAWEWHQDYGYWYDNGCLFPDMASCLIAVDRATRANGCLQVLKGSHRMGRINHVPIGDQTGADPERVAAARAAGAGPRRAGARLGHLLPQQPAPPLRPQHQPRPALGADLLLQHEEQRPIQGVAAPALQLPGKMAG